MGNVKYDRRALTEVYEVLLMLGTNQYKKIPENIISAIRENRDTEYEVDINEIEDNMLPDTEKILASIYMYYLANSEEKQMLIEMTELEKRQKYGTQVIFNKNNEEKEDISKELVPILVNETIIQKIKKWIKKILKI